MEQMRIELEATKKEYNLRLEEAERREERLRAVMAENEFTQVRRVTKPAEVD